MNEEHSGKTAVIKTLAIVGLIATILLSVWLLVQVVSFVPETFSSLASIAEGLQSERSSDEFTIETEKSIVNSGEELQVNWTDLKRDGAYNFSYECTDGVSANVLSVEGDVVDVNCTDVLSLPGDVTGLNISFLSVSRRFIDVPFAISFTNENDEVISEENGKVTVVNATIPQNRGALAVDDEGVVEIVETPLNEELTEEVAVKEEPSTTETLTPSTVERIVSYIPQSYENGFIDLKTTYLGIGRLVDGSFEVRAGFNPDDRGAFKFEVINIGTKTSEEWEFTATLPSGLVFKSDEQAPLKPNERVEFTLGFSVNESPQLATIKVSTEVPNDTDNSNDNFTWSVKITE